MKKDRRDSVSSTSSSYSSDSSDSSASSSDNTEEFQVQIREREDPNQDYQRPELLKQAIAEIEAEVAAKAEKEQAEDSSSSEYESDSDEEEDDDAKQLTPAVDSQIFRTIAAIRAKDPRVYDKTDFFKDIKPEIRETKKEEKPMTLKDYEREMLLSHGGHVEDEDRENYGQEDLTHNQEQEMLRNAFKSVAENEEDEDDDFLVKKEKTKEEKEEEESEYKKFLLEQMKNDDITKEAFKEWTNYKNNPNISEEDAFLMDYVLNRGWVEKENSHVEINEEEVEKDEAELDDIDRFESKYNFRFEEEGASTIQSYARDIDGTVRRKESKRAKRRAREKAKKEALKQQKIEDLKQQKNKKMKEIKDKLKEIYEISGSKALGLENIDLDADFDPEKFDEQMNSVFNEDYYAEGENVNEKPTWNDDIDTGLPDDDNDNFIMDADYLPGGEKYTGNDKKRKLESEDNEDNESKRAKREQIEKLMDEYYSLNYEDVIGGDVYTRFKYTKTEPENYGLTPEEILLADDAELNKYVGIKQLAPYRPEYKKKVEKKYFKKNKTMKKRDIEKHIAQVVKTLPSPPPTTLKSESSKKKKTQKQKKKQIY
ncbi:hypothetical protein G6F70_003364 [Rhizopus microsporus]|uniref:Kri1-like C-terminal domain-containing protein n=2 Tax=Rhizopus TaxID=4842 RepID=A0A367K6B5_RHIAZ|nr:hypothetical protein G6F71_003182 [Rhizopus microsporus]RCH97717.1 hypothetical protein CU097_014893 [Rhizopus azygosporus]KAG1201203.1 hypothetical protein G6F70_003364 [Rhizopus microsporus]KAG1213313.1 hypothetical protein G6F69_002922 [Rhizopus microsporus]KAG1235326.1 hypothetical protein G6F67_002854 [Rhizopus microsporus]